MSLHSLDGKTNRIDIRDDRIAAGTMGDSYITPRSIPGKAINTIVDDQDPRINYGTIASGTASFSASRQTGFESGGTFTAFNTQYSAAELRFNGTAAGILGAAMNDAGTITVYVDGEEKRGRVPEYESFNYASYAFDTDIAITDTTFWVDSAANFTVGNYHMLDDEVFKILSVTVTNTDIHGTSSSGVGYITVERGAEGTTASAHNANHTIYRWASSINLDTGYQWDFDLRKLLWYNPFLGTGTHKIVVALTGSSGSFNFDGFLLGGLVGQDQMAIEYGSARVSGNFNADGYSNAVIELNTRTGATIISVLSVSQITPDPTVGNANCKAWFSGAGGTLDLYLVNGPASQAYVVEIIFTYISESI